MFVYTNSVGFAEDDDDDGGEDEDDAREETQGERLAKNEDAD